MGAAVRGLVFLLGLFGLFLVGAECVHAAGVDLTPIFLKAGPVGQFLDWALDFYTSYLTALIDALAAMLHVSTDPDEAKNQAGVLLLQWGPRILAMLATGGICVRSVRR